MSRWSSGKDIRKQMEAKKYVCECGKEFESPNSFNGHKSFCIVHLQIKGVLDRNREIKRNCGFAVSKLNAERYKRRKQQELEHWVSEKHTCEKCGKVMIEKFGSGRFCCRACANSRKQTEYSNKKRSNSIKIRNASEEKLNVRLAREAEYNLNPKVCKNCGNSLQYKQRNLTYCCDNCLKEGLRRAAKDRNFGGETPGAGTGKGGWYKGIRCDSRYELIYLIYCLENSINIERSNKSFIYTSYDGKEHRYYPDFYLPDSNTFIELKGFNRKDVPYKLAKIKEIGLNYKILYWDDIKPLYIFVKDRFNVSYNSLQKLYDTRICGTMDELVESPPLHGGI